MTDFTVDEFITEMEKLFGVEEQGYIKVLEKAKEMKKENDILKEGNVNYCDILNKAKEIADMLVEANELNKKALHTMTKMKKEIEELKKENTELGEKNEENVKLKKISNVKTDLIENLFSKIVKNADIDDGFSISKEYGHKYIDEWNKMYEDLIKDTIKVMNENELVDGGLYLEFHNCGNIEFCVMNSDSDEEDSDED